MKIINKTQKRSFSIGLKTYGTFFIFLFILKYPVMHLINHFNFKEPLQNNKFQDFYRLLDLRESSKHRHTIVII